MKYKTILLLALIAFGVTLAVIVGQRLSAEAMAVIIGVVAGVAASIPTSLIVVWIATRPAPGARSVPAPIVESRAEEPRETKVVVVQAPALPLQPPQVNPYGYSYPQPYAAQTPAYAPTYAPLPSSRTFTVIGGETLEDFEAL